MRRIHSFVLVIVGAGLLTLAGCEGSSGPDVKKLQSDLDYANRQNQMLKADEQKLKDALEKSELSFADANDAKNKLRVQVDSLTKSRDELTGKVNELGKTVDGLTSARTALEKQVADLTKARNAAMEDARSAQGKIEELNVKIKTQTQQMTELQEQIVNIRTVLDHLQQNLK
jgi:chromosome segregation ATPase